MPTNRLDFSVSDLIMGYLGTYDADAVCYGNRRARDNLERPPRKLDSDALEIMLAYVAENDAIRGMAHNPQN